MFQRTMLPGVGVRLATKRMTTESAHLCAKASYVELMPSVSSPPPGPPVPVLKEPLGTRSQEEAVFLKYVLELTLAPNPSPAFQESAGNAVIQPPVESTPLVMQTQTNVSAKMDLWEMETSCVCLQSFLPSVLLAVDPTATVPTVYPTSVPVMMAILETPTRVVFLLLKNREKTVGVVTMQNVSTLQEEECVNVLLATMEIPILAVMTSMSAPTRFVETMPFVSIPLEALTAVVNKITEETPLKPVSQSHLQLLISATMSAVDPMQCAL